MRKLLLMLSLFFVSYEYRFPNGDWGFGDASVIISQIKNYDDIEEVKKIIKNKIEHYPFGTSIIIISFQEF